MRAGQLLAAAPLRHGSPVPIADPDLCGITSDSRLVEPGFLFVALAGARADGRRFVADAVARGAAAILTDPAGAEALGPDLAVPVFADARPRRALALAAARLYPGQPEITVAVTGTNGKSSTVSFARQIWAALGRRAASLGTLGLEGPGVDRPGGLTTPDPVALHRDLMGLAAAGVGCVALEASSHGLDQHRLDGIRLDAAAFTNLTQDHLDYHGSASSYFAAKRRLFAELLPPGRPAIINSDSAAGRQLAEELPGLGRSVLDYGARARHMRLVERQIRADGQDLTLELDGVRHRVALGLIGEFQAMNALAALGLVVATGADPAAAVASLGRLAGVRGRLERVATLANGAVVYVDYAHTPDGLEQVLGAIRPHVAGRLVCLFGAGGDRDPTKRPVMGAVVSARADLAIVTDDNPRTEDPAAIRRAILAACPDALEIGDRRAAIAHAVELLRSGDVLVVAGKGHEQGQIVGAAVLPFDDATVVRDLVGSASPAGAGS